MWDGLTDRCPRGVDLPSITTADGVIDYSSGKARDRPRPLVPCRLRSGLYGWFQATLKRNPPSSGR
jgi:hypothetical protein